MRILFVQFFSQYNLYSPSPLRLRYCAMYYITERCQLKSYERVWLCIRDASYVQS